jgi:hypothetical protein
MIHSAKKYCLAMWKFLEICYQIGFFFNKIINVKDQSYVTCTILTAHQSQII